MPGQVYMMTAKIPKTGLEKFNEYERKVLPLLKEYGARLDRRLRTADLLTEVHLLWFPSTQAFATYRNDTRRAEHSHLLVESGASIELLELCEVLE